MKIKKSTLSLILVGISFGISAQDETVNGKLTINSTADVGRGQDPALLIGTRTGEHIAIDNNEIGAFNNNVNSTLFLNGSQSTSNTIINGDGTGNLGIRTNTPSAVLHINSTADVGRGQDPALLIGTRTGEHIAIDNNEIGAFNNNVNSTLFLNGSQSTSNTIINGDGTGYVGIGTTNPDSELTVKGKIHCEEVKVDVAVPADYVFEKYYTGVSELKADYTMPTLAEVETYTKENHHLPNIPSATEIKEEGLHLKEMTNLLLQKVEELTLYTIEQHKEIKLLKEKVSNLEN